ncbi:MAG TPA: hypothetical protein VGB08_01690 [Allosphingosinicella sp.]|jgi:hypothetical protein
MDVTVELHCDQCGSANLSLPDAADDSAEIGCNDCGAGQGTIAELRDELIACALEQSAEKRREGLGRLP